MNAPHDILITGGGLVGPLMALAASEAGLRACVIDALPRETRADPAFDGRAYAMALASCRMLRALGLWERLEPDAQPILDIRVADGRAGTGATSPVLHFDHAEIEEGPMGHMIEDRHLRATLLDAMDADPRVTHLAGETVVAQDVQAGHVAVTLAGGAQMRGALLVGADGRQSGTALRAGIARRGWAYDQASVVCAVAHERSHEGCAWQFFMPEGPLAILPLSGDRSAVVWSQGAARAEEVMAMDEAAFLDALRPAFGSFLGEISLVGERYRYPLGLSLAEDFVAPRVALTGDAAHGVHPIAGQGLNAGLRDVAALAHVARDARMRGEDVGGPQALARYQAWRRFDTASLGAATDIFNRLFSNDNPLLRLVRGAGLGVVAAAPALRRTFIREAAGLTGDLPRLMQG